jgi:hypothetical protein
VPKAMRFQASQNPRVTPAWLRACIPGEGQPGAAGGAAEGAGGLAGAPRASARAGRRLEGAHGGMCRVDAPVRVCLSVRLSVHPSVFCTRRTLTGGRAWRHVQSGRSRPCLSVRLSVRPSFLRWPVRLSVCLSVSLSVCSSSWFPSVWRPEAMGRGDSMFNGSRG